MSKIKWGEMNTVVIDPPKKPKKITGTRFASILGYDPYNSPFATWCEITRAYQDPFVDNIYTIAGKTIEPKIQAYLKELYWDDLVTPEDVYGPNPFKKTYGDFYKEHRFLGGMWDAKVPSEEMIIEIKTTVGVERWMDGAPVFQALQASLYAYLEGWSSVAMIGVLLTQYDLENPTEFVPNAGNVVIDIFDIYDRFPDFDEYLARALVFHRNHVLEGVSPPYDEVRDAEYLKGLRTISPPIDADVSEMIAEARVLIGKIEKIKEGLKEPEKRLKEIEGCLKEYLLGDLSKDHGAGWATISGSGMEYTLTKASKFVVDEKKMEIDGVLERYQVEKEAYTLRKKIVEDK